MADALRLRSIPGGDVLPLRERAEPGFVDLGQEPPLDPSGANGQEIDRRAVNLRWLGASVIAALSGAILVGAAIQLSIDQDLVTADEPERVRSVAGPAEQTPSHARKGDKLVRTEAIAGARQTFRAPMTLRGPDREIIRVRPFVKVSSGLMLTSGVYASNIPPFNPLRLFAESGNTPERTAEAPPETAEADVSVVKLDLAALTIEEGEHRLSDEEVLAQIDEDRRAIAEAGRRPALPIPPQLMLSRTLRQAPGALPDPAASYAPTGEGAFSALEVRVVPENVSAVAKTSPQPGAPLSEIRTVQIKRGETFDQVLRAQGTDAEQLRTLVAALGGRARINALPEGQMLNVLVAPAPIPNAPPLPVRVALVEDSKIRALAAMNDRGEFVPVAPPADTTARRTADNEESGEENGENARGATLYASLYETGIKNELPRPVLDELVRVFAYDVDFQRRVAGGDSLDVFLAEDEENGERGEILFASLSVGGETRRIFRYVSPEDGSVDYFDEEGKSLKKFLLRKPITDGELRSGFGYRRHPILGYTRMHTGVDWSNRIGTPIVASGNGTVIKAEWDGGYGRRVEIQHANGYVTTYSHMSAFARGITDGAKVRQGQVIGYLGSSGLSTGPHLHYEVMVNGHFVNPMKIRVPRGRELEGRALAEFKRQRDQIQALMQRGPGPRFAQNVAP